MKYDLIRLDGRFTHRDKFEYAIKFSNSMARGLGPLYFNQAVEWFHDTYGYSAEIRQYDNIVKWVNNSQLIANHSSAKRLGQGILQERPESCNPHWSWTNGYDDLRIYVCSSAEANFFQLRWPRDE